MLFQNLPVGKYFAQIFEFYLVIGICQQGLSCPKILIRKHRIARRISEHFTETAEEMEKKSEVKEAGGSRTSPRGRSESLPLDQYYPWSVQP